MGQIEGSILSLILVASLVILFFNRWMLDALIVAINNFRGALRLQCILALQMTAFCFGGRPGKLRICPG